MLTYHAIAVLCIMATAFFLYTRSWIRIELVSLAMLATLMALFHVFPFSGVNGKLNDVDIIGAFGHPALIAIAALMILGRGLTLTGALEPMVRLLARLWKFSASLGLLVTLMMAALASAFVNDTPVMVLMLPLLLGISARTGIAPSKTLMPVNFAVLVGGMLTSIGTSTNILVLSIAAQLGLPAMGIFDFTAIAAAATLVALPYLWLIAPRLLPAHARNATAAEREYQARLVVEADSKLASMTVESLAKTLGRDLKLSALIRADQSVPITEKIAFLPGDLLHIIDTPKGLQEIAAICATPLIDHKLQEAFAINDGARVDQAMAEIVIAANSPWIGNTIEQVGFAKRFKVAVIGLYGEHALSSSLGALDVRQQRLQPADVLLIQGREDHVRALSDQEGMMLLNSSMRIPRTPKAPWALGIMALVIILAATRLLPIHLAALFGVIAMLVTGCVLIEGLGRSLSLEVVLLVTSSIALGQALVVTGGADWLASGMVHVIRDFPPALQVASFIAFAALLTNFVSNSAAASIGTPIAMAMASMLGAPAQPFVLAILFGANLSFATPMAYQTNLLVMNAAGYSFRDFVRVGTPLVIMMVITLSILLARQYQL